MFASRRSATDAGSIVIGRFKAPAPERIFHQRVPKSSETSSQTVGASYRIVSADYPEVPEKIVHGIVGSSTSLDKRIAPQQQQQPKSRQVSAKIQVSDEGLDYPPSKLSADIYGNVAEIVTAPPEAVESDFLLPKSKLFGSRRSN